ncbi:precorrin-6A synthase (deacetylating) [Monaibacterium marinum]|uniref:Precorrin-6A synthase [deacetylating] n=1 Tax=Pontivivens marinum TaxID=1690039 RepID=A0A2C9CV17_9RHOB|nr:precorrin-6A synthase (deacetylating) [Monaibacterium marinum]SOH94259.1 precorrin-6A synthase (deacetylating) [Monaibacterium marinum]
MIDLMLIGIGTGNPEHVTAEAARLLASADLVLIPEKGEDKSDLAQVRRQICGSILTDSTRVVSFDLPVRDEATPDYLARVGDWHYAIAQIWAREIRSNLDGSGKVAFLVWGDPSLYDSTLRIAERVASVMPLRVKVVPGITSLQALTAAHAIPVNDLGKPFTVTTGRQLRDHGWPDGVDTIAVMLDGQCSFQGLAPDGVHIWWSGYAGMHNEINLSGPLEDTAPRILAARAAARAQHGWIMDIYLMRRQAQVGEIND